ncbi:phosphoribosyltransferase [Thermosulfurimonas marina]|uniref:Phosphoribosyltransferase n=2 Tax=Thermosulfurimonas marina TaxID=2047767 RepID=A0A6H1WUU2_9BACT|nr:phosphoribosyltransferase [Thermosulfurimonas marina]
MLRPAYEKGPPGWILAIPAGGVPVAVEVARALKWPLDLLLVKKLPLPWNPEAGFGALTIEGDLLVNREAMRYFRLTEEDLAWARERAREELQKRNRLLRGGRPYPDLSGKTVLLVDDGLASGFTMLAGVQMVRRKGVSKVIVAVPTASERSLELLEPQVDEIYCPNVRSGPYFAVADAYQNWYDLDYEEVLDFLKSLEKSSTP